MTKPDPSASNPSPESGRKRRVGIYDRPKSADLPVRKIAIALGLLMALVYLWILLRAT